MADTFENLMIRAEAMYAVDTDHSDYWNGYIRGLRRAYHGEAFGTVAEHTEWSQLVDDPDESRRQMGKGYLAGLAALGKNI